MSPIIDAIAVHHAAWQDLQSAAPSHAACAEDRETEALMALLSTPPATSGDLKALGPHLAWYCRHEGDQAGLQAQALNAALLMTLPVIQKASELLSAVDFDNNGSMVAGELRGGNGGLLSRETTKAADDLRRALAQVAP